MRNEIDLWRPNFFGWKPRALFGEIQRTMDKALGDMLGDLPATDWKELSFQPTSELEETESYYLAKFDLPGIPKDDIKIEMNGDTLHVWGERKEEVKDKKGSTRVCETRYGRFERYFTLPTKVDEKNVEASCENGVLSIYLPKTVTAKGQEIKIGEGKGFLKNLTSKKQDKETAKATGH